MSESELAAEHWAQASEKLQVLKWQRRALRKRWMWQFTIWFSMGLKRVFDFVAALGALVVFSPIFLVTAILVKLEDGGPVFFNQIRIGKGGKAFAIWKFRSMRVDADAIKAQLLEQNQHAAGVTFKMKADPRITKVGKWIRKLSIDEFPQFYNVLRGDMSLVGPRPPVPVEVASYKAFHLRRLRVKPGITCFWQIGGRANIDFEGQVRLDLRYIHSQTFWKDIVILLKTVPAVVLSRGAY